MEVIATVGAVASAAAVAIELGRVAAFWFQCVQYHLTHCTLTAISGTATYTQKVHGLKDATQWNLSQTIRLSASAIGDTMARSGTLQGTANWQLLWVDTDSANGCNVTGTTQPFPAMYTSQLTGSWQRNTDHSCTVSLSSNPTLGTYTIVDRVSGANCVSGPSQVGIMPWIDCTGTFGAGTLVNGASDVVKDVGSMFGGPAPPDFAIDESQVHCHLQATAGQ